MNVFEDLIDELKDENLLEDTVANGEKKAASNIPEIVEPADDPEFAALDEPQNPVEIEVVESGGESEIPGEAVQVSKKPRAGKEYFKKRAVDEISGLQMVEHIFTGVEREYMKVVPKAFDEFNAKKALNNFLNAAEDPNSDDYKSADLALRKETERWGLALIERDGKIAVANIRQYCENSRPALSSQAMLSLARFYRNAPYSEPVRSKFDFVITRLFSRPVEQDKRACLFKRDEMLSHIRTLYGEWSSVPLYDADDDESNVLLTGLSFDDLAIEAESAAKFDQLIERDFFGRLRLFKESISELFFAPTVIASAIESNIRIGNAYVNLIVRERRKMDAASVELKYSEFNDASVSDAAGRTLDLVELLKGLTDDVLNAAEPPQEQPEAANQSASTDAPKPAVKKAKERSPLAAKLIRDVLDINRWLLSVGIILVLLCTGLYVWSTYIVDERVSTAGVEKVEVESSLLSEHVESGRISHEMFFGSLLPTWDALSKDKREAYLQKVLQLGAEKGYKEVVLTAKDGKQAAYAASDRLEVYMP
jgi:hypothetical protein